MFATKRGSTKQLKMIEMIRPFFRERKDSNSRTVQVLTDQHTGHVFSNIGKSKDENLKQETIEFQFIVSRPTLL